VRKKDIQYEFHVHRGKSNYKVSYEKWKKILLRFPSLENNKPSRAKLKRNLPKLTMEMQEYETSWDLETLQLPMLMTKCTAITVSN